MEGEEFSLAVLEFFRTGSLLKQINHSAIALVPKNSHASRVGDYRPISCCNVFYKVLSKILASRISGFLESVFDPAQAAGRVLSENIHLAQELLRKYCRKRVSPRKVDIQKLILLIGAFCVRYSLAWASQ